VIANTGDTVPLKSESPKKNRSMDFQWKYTAPWGYAMMERMTGGRGMSLKVEQGAGRGACRVAAWAHEKKRGLVGRGGGGVAASTGAPAGPACSTAATWGRGRPMLGRLEAPSHPTPPHRSTWASHELGCNCGPVLCADREVYVTHPP
jgi:hypothetical protein